MNNMLKLSPAFIMSSRNLFWARSFAMSAIFSSSSFNVVSHSFLVTPTMEIVGSKSFSGSGV